MSSIPEAALADVLLACMPTDGSTAILRVARRLSQCRPDSAGLVTASVLARLLQKSSGFTDTSMSAVEVNEASELLLSFVSDALRRCKVDDVAQIRSIVSLCQKYPKLMDFIVQGCVQTLRKHCGVLVFVPTEASVPTALSLDESRVDSSFSHEEPHAHYDVNVFNSLAFLKVLVWCTEDYTAIIPKKIVKLLLILVGASVKPLSSGSYDTLLALISRIPQHSPDCERCVWHEKEPTSLVWHRLRELISEKNDTCYRDMGFSVWSRSLSSENQIFLSPVILQTEEYWASLRSGLSNGTAQHRKHCLSILRTSLALIEGDVMCPSMRVTATSRLECQLQFSRYSTLFETIVLSRYLNQVQDCFPDLDKISQPECIVQETWVVALLTGALAHGMQDSIRKLIGDWTLAHGVRILRRAIGTIAEFLETCFLPWASQGYLFTSSINGNASATLVCRHGEQLRTFLREIMVSDMDQPKQNMILKAILSFIVARGPQMFPFARAFILGGLAEGVSLLECRLDADEVAMVLHVCSVAGFQGMVRDLMTLQCRRLAESGTDAARSQNNLKPLLQACSALEQIDKTPDDCLEASQYLHNSAQSHAVKMGADWSPGDPTGYRNSPSICIFNTWVDVSHHRCLAGSGLEAASDYLRRALDNSDANNTPAGELDRALRAVWDEVEVQEYPKLIVMKIPYIFFHENCVRLCTPGNELTATLSRCALDLQRLAENRVYAFAPLASALRKVILVVPEAVALPFAELFVRFANFPPATKVEFEMEAVISGKLEAFIPSRTYSAYYGESEGYGHACLFDTLNKLPNTERWLKLRQHVLDEILGLWLNQKQPVPVSSRWKTTSQLRTLLIISEALIQTWSVNELDYYLKSYKHILALEPLPRLRYLLEWIIARIYVHKVDRRHEVLRDLVDHDLSNPKHTASLMKMALMLASLPDSEETLVLEYMTQLIPLAASPKIVIRHEAHWTFPLLWDQALKHGWRSMLDNPAFARLNSHIRGLETYKNPPVGRLIEAFHPIEDHTLSNLFQGEYLSIEPSEPQKVSREDFLAVWKNDTQHGSLFNRLEGTGLLPLGKERRQSRISSATPAAQAAPGLSQESTSAVPLQTKASTWQDYIPDPLDQSSPSPTRRASDVIVISSLISNAYNLGGLSRVCEIFGVRSLQVPSLGVLKNKDFTSVSVSSHLWLPIAELEPGAVPEFLVQRKLEGYTVVGIEQTDSSRMLGRPGWGFPRKTVLVLGSEREGIPARLLGDMNFCVEIRQVGLTRSMNVQTAAAVVLYEYAKQHP